jgi:integrase
MNDSATWGVVRSAPRVKLLTVSETPFEDLQKDQTERLLSHAATAAPNDHALYMAGRFRWRAHGALYGMRWADIDLEHGMMTIRRSHDQPFTKVRGSRLNRQRRRAQGVEGQVPCEPDGLAFPAADGFDARAREAAHGFAQLLEASRCPAIGFHGLRHACASLMSSRAPPAGRADAPRPQLDHDDGEVLAPRARLRGTRGRPPVARRAAGPRSAHGPAGRADRLASTRRRSSRGRSPRSSMRPSWRGSAAGP